MTLPFARTSFPEMYEQELVGPIFSPWVEPVFQAVGLAEGERVLDVACGTGIVARLARERVGEAGRVVGVDSNAGMLAVARRVAPEIDWREGEAGALPLGADERFDVVTCQQGLQFFPDRLAAARQMRRALDARGRVALSTWRSDEENPFLTELRRVAERRLGPIVDRRHACGEAAPLEALLREAGFRDIRSRILSRTIRFQDGSAYLRLNATALVGMSAASKEMSEEERGRLVAAIARDSADVARSRTGAAGLAYELATNLVTAAV